MKVLVITFGSRGDVNPLLVVAHQLERKGHDVVLCGSENFRGLVEGFGIRFVPHLSEKQYADIESDLDLWHYRRALPALSRKAIIPCLDLIYRVIEREMSDEFVIVASPLAFAARIAEEKLGLKLVQLHYAPAALRSVYDTAQVGGLPMGPAMPLFYKKLIWWMIDRFVLDPPLKKELNCFRKKIGLAPVSRLFNRWWFSACHNALVFSEHYARRQKDWPETSEMYDFPCFDGDDAVPADAGDFLAAGSPPVVFTFGTAFVFGEQLFEAALEALRRLNLRGIFLTRNLDDIPQNLPGSVLAARFLPLGKILPSCAAIVHHGGIGTIAQAARAGIPQLIRPMSFDQPDNAFRIHIQKLGSYIRPQMYGPDLLCEKLNYILGDEEIKAGCQALSRKLDSERALERLVLKIEQIGQGRQ
ncbi:MAG: hypothetical protein GY868_17035 [Deltaproteobacteria bacterium]|nr:hypothetical protein [Deltaproteobacteria bacterium]MCP4716830.1 hypothetical protein [Deltaproteobacteria bacterium]